MSSPTVDTDADWVAAAYAAHGASSIGSPCDPLGDSGLAEEAVQTTYLHGWKAAARFDESLGSLRTWLFAIVRNVVVDMARAAARRPPLADASVAEQTTHHWPASESDVDRMLVAWQVEEALRRLSSDHRKALIEIYFHGRSYEEVALEFAIPTGTVKSRVYCTRSRHCDWRSKSWDGTAMNDACREWRGDIAGLALDRLRPDERARALAHVDSCADCRAELAVLEHLSRAMTHADATRLDDEPAPPPELRDRIMTRLNDERAVVRRQSRKRMRRALAAVAAVVLLAVGVGVVLHDGGGSDPVPFESALADTSGSFRVAPQLDRHIDHVHPGRSRSARDLLVVAHRRHGQAGGGGHVQRHRDSGHRHDASGATDRPRRTSMGHRQSGRGGARQGALGARLV